MFSNMRAVAKKEGGAAAAAAAGAGAAAAAAAGAGEAAATREAAAGGALGLAVPSVVDARRLPGTSLEELVRVEALDVDVFRGCKLWKPVAGRAVFGGQVVAQALAACCATVATAEFALHSAHAYFCLPGDPTTPILYMVQRLRDGKSYVTRGCSAVQRGKTIFVALASFHRIDEPSAVEHAYAPPAAPPPDAIPDAAARLRAVLADPRLPSVFRGRVEAQLAEDNPIDLRYCRQSDPLDPGVDAPVQLVWLRAKARLDDGPAGGVPPLPIHAARALHACAIAFASDFSLLGNALLPHGSPNPSVSFMSSLDHAMWFHAPARADAWLLYELESPRLVHGRGFSVGRMFRTDGVLAVSTAQEGVIRFHPDYPSEPPVAITRGPLTAWRLSSAADGEDGDVPAPSSSSGPPPGAAAHGIATQPLATWGSTPPALAPPPDLRARL